MNAPAPLRGFGLLCMLLGGALMGVVSRGGLFYDKDDRTEVEAPAPAA